MLLSVALTLETGRARAQTPEQLTLRTELLQIAERSRVTGEHQRALDAAQRAQRIQSTASLELFIATEHVALAQHARAYESALACVRSASVPGTRNGEAIRAECQRIANEARPRLAQVIIDPPRPLAAGLEVRVNGAPLDEVLFGISYFVDPGVVRVEASALGRAAWSRALRLEAGQSQTVSPEPGATPVATPSNAREVPSLVEGESAAARPASEREEPAPRRTVRTSMLRPVAYVGFGLGAASVIGGASLLAAREGVVSEYNARFDQGECAGSDLRERDACADVANRADLFRAAGVGLAVAGVVLAGVSTGLFVAGAPRVLEERTARCAPSTTGVTCALAF